jgi:hypothetical protein
MKPFLPGIVWAAVLVVNVPAAHDRLTRQFAGRAWLASTLVTLLVAAFIVVPIVVAAVQVVQGGIEAYKWGRRRRTAESGADHSGPPTAGRRVNDAVVRAKELFGLANFDAKAEAIQLAKTIGGLGGRAGAPSCSRERSRSSSPSSS